MATVNTSLQLVDQFSSMLAVAERRLDRLTVIERLPQKQRVAMSIGIESSAAVHVAMDSTEILQKAAALNSRIQTIVGPIHAPVEIDLAKVIDIEAHPVALTTPSEAFVGGSSITAPGSSIVDNAANNPVKPPDGKAGSGVLSKYLEKIKGNATEYLSKAAQKSVDRGVQMQQKENLLGVRVGDLQLGKALFASMVHQANELNVSAQDLSVTWNSFLPLSKNVGELKQMVEWTNRLSKLDPALGNEGATNAMKEIMAGNTSSLADQFKIPPGMEEQLKAAASSGDFNKVGAVVEKLFGQLKMTKDQAAALNGQPLNQLTGDISVLSNFIDVFSKNVVQAAANIYVWFKENLPEAIQKTQDVLLNIWSKVQPVLTFLAQGIAIAGIGFLTFWLIGILVNYNLVTLITSFAMLGYTAVISALKAAASWLVANLSILLTIAIIALVIAAFLYFGGTVDQVIGVVVGSLFFLGAVIWDVIAGALKVVITIVLVVGETFMAIAGVILSGVSIAGNAIYDLLLTPLELVVKGLNKLIHLANKIPGINIPDIPDTDKWFGGDKTPINLGGPILNATKKLDAFREKAVNAIPYVNPMDAGKNGNKLGNGAIGSVKSGVGNLMDKTGGMFKLGNGAPDSTLLDGSLSKTLKGVEGPPNNTVMGGQLNRVDEIGGIENTVDISSEDLKVMRDLAEMKSIQNFVTLTPTVQVSTGDIHEKADIHEIIRGIEDSLAGTISTSAQGVYA